MRGDGSSSPPMPPSTTHLLSAQCASLDCMPRQSHARLPLPPAPPTRWLGTATAAAADAAVCELAEGSPKKVCLDRLSYYLDLSGPSLPAGLPTPTCSVALARECVCPDGFKWVLELGPSDLAAGFNESGYCAGERAPPPLPPTPLGPMPPRLVHEVYRLARLRV
jgi:hypothetical protein